MFHKGGWEGTQQMYVNSIEDHKWEQLKHLHNHYYIFLGAKSVPIP